MTLHRITALAFAIVALFAFSACAETTGDCPAEAAREQNQGRHSYQMEFQVLPTCTEDGYTVYQCAYCGESYQVSLPAVGHQWEEAESKEPSCTENGEILHRCGVCGEEWAETVSAWGHDYVFVENVYSDCLTPGKAVYACTRCNDRYEEEIPAPGHQYDEGKLEAGGNCKTRSLYRYTCLKCGYIEWKYGEAGPHQWGEWVIIQQPSLAAPGLQERTCDVCGKTEQREIAYEAADASPAMGGENVWPALAVRFTPSENSGNKEGETAEFFITLENTGNVALVLNSLQQKNNASDTVPPDFDFTAWNAYYAMTLQPGEAITAPYRTPITAQDIAAKAVSRVINVLCHYQVSASQQGNYESDDTVLTLDLTEEEEAPFRLALHVTVLNDKEIYALSPSGKTEEPLQYLCTVTNLGPEACVLNAIHFVFSHAAEENEVVDVHLFPGESRTVAVKKYLKNAFILEGSGNDAFAGLTEAALTAVAAADGNPEISVSSNEATFTHYLSKPQTGFGVWQLPDETAPEDVTVQVNLISASANQEGYGIREKAVFQAAVTNRSNRTLDAVAVYASLEDGGEAGEPADVFRGMNPGDTRFFNVEHTITAQDVARGCIYQIVSAAWEDPVSGNRLASYSDPMVTLTRDLSRNTDSPLIVSVSVLNQPAKGQCFSSGDTVQYQYEIVNVSDQAMYRASVSLVSENGEESEPIRVYDMIVPRASETLTEEYVVTAQDMEKGTLERQIRVSAQTRKGNAYSSVSNPFALPVGYPGAVSSGDPVFFRAVQDITGINPGLSLMITETSTPENGNSYGEKETVAYLVSLTNTGETVLTNIRLYDTLEESGWEPIRRIERMEPGDYASCEYTHTVSAEDFEAHTVIAVFDAGENLTNLSVSSDTVISKTGSETMGGAQLLGWLELEDAEQAGSFCERTLLALGSSASEYTVRACQEHGKLLEDMQTLMNQAASQEDKRNAWQQSEEMWREALEKAYQDYTNDAMGSARGIVMKERIAYNRYLDSLEKILLQKYAARPEAAAQIMTEEIMNRCLSLCYEMHHGASGRLDSVVTGKYVRMASASGQEKCMHLTMMMQSDTLQYRDILCDKHAETEGYAEELIEKAKGAQETADACLSAQRLWQMALDEEIAEHYREADGDTRAMIALNRLYLNQALEARQELLRLRYAGKEEITAELICDMLKNAVQTICRSW